MTPMLKQVLELTAAQENIQPLFKQGVRLAGLEDTITLAKPDYREAAESILDPMMAALLDRYDRRECASYQLLNEIEDAAQRLRAALMAADDAENV